MGATGDRRIEVRARLVSTGLCAVLALLGSLAGLQAWAGDRSAARLERSGDLVEAYLVINRAVTEQDAIEESYEDEATVEERRRFGVAAEQIRGAIRTLLAEGSADDRALARRIAAAARRYALEMEAFFAAVDRGDAAAADRIDEERVDAWSSRLATLATQSGPVHASDSIHEVDALRSTQRSLLAATIVVLPVGVVVLAGLSLVLRSMRRRVAALHAAELGRLEHAALTDSLTGIGNHRAFEETLTRELARAAREGTVTGLAMFDLDDLKVANDTGGHQAGDRLLKDVAAALASTARASDSVFRTGGDEYAAILPNTRTWGAFDFAQRVHAVLAEGPASVSTGIFAGAGERPDLIVARADAALLTAKREGRKTVVFVPGMQPSAAAAGRDDKRHEQATLAAALARAVDAKDSWTQSHCETVAELCRLTATALGLAPERVEAIRLAGLVHDVGKIGVPDAILQKPARLEPAEYEIIKSHTTLGQKILHHTALERQAPWILHHHERIDGGGYPSGLRGEDIPLEARIIHVADAFEAMISDRPYRAGMPEEAAIAELRGHAGTQFDEQVVDALVLALSRSAVAG